MPRSAGRSQMAADPPAEERDPGLEPGENEEDMEQHELAEDQQELQEDEEEEEEFDEDEFPEGEIIEEDVYGE